MIRDYYRVLGVSRHASPADLRAAYARLAKRHHPDLAPSGDSLPQRLREVQQAYRCLSDVHRRAAHDEALNAQVHMHYASQHVLHRRLRRFDRRHPRRPPRRRSGQPWRMMLAIASVGIVVSFAWLS